MFPLPSPGASALAPPLDLLPVAPAPGPALHVHIAVRMAMSVTPYVSEVCECCPSLSSPVQSLHVGIDDASKRRCHETRRCHTTPQQTSWVLALRNESHASKPAVRRSHRGILRGREKGQAMDALDGGGASLRECAYRKAQRASVEGCSRGKIISWHLQPAAHKSTGAPGCHRKSPS